MSLKEQIQNDLKAAMKAGDKEKRDILRQLSAAFKQFEVDSRGEDLTEEKALQILMKEAKRREESIADLKKADRDTSQEEFELSLIQTYLPQQLDEDAIRGLAKEAIAETGADSPKAMGDVMKVLMPRLQGQADGKTVSKIVRDLLA